MIDLIQTNKNNSYKFIVNTAVASVPLVAVTPAIPPWLERYDSKSYFQYGDNIKVISLGINIKEGYTIHSDDFFHNSISMGFVGSIFGAGNVTLQPSGIVIPFDSYEISYGQFFDLSKLSGYTNKMRFVCDLELQSPRISMLGIPASEDTKEYYVSIFAKIEHTLEMVA